MSPDRFFAHAANAAFVAGTARKPKVYLGTSPHLILFLVPFAGAAIYAFVIAQIGVALAWIVILAVGAISVWRGSAGRRRLVREGKAVDGKILDLGRASPDEGASFPFVRYELVSPASGERLIGSHDLCDGDPLPNKGDPVSVLYVDDDLHALL